MSAVLREGGLASVAAAPRGTLSMPVSEPVVGAAVEKKLSATERIEASRRELRQAMLATVRPDPKGASAGPGPVRSVFDMLRHLPGASLVVDTVLEWWARHPLRDASVIAREASGAIFRPIARENPMKLVFGAVLVGALLVALKPWRFMLRSAIFAGLVPQFAAMALRRLPLATWIGMFARRSKSSRAARSAASTGVSRPQPR